MRRSKKRRAEDAQKIPDPPLKRSKTSKEEREANKETKKAMQADFWTKVDSLLLKIESSNELLSIVANWEQNARLSQLLQQWEAQANRTGGAQFSGNLWAVMLQRALRQLPNAFPRFVDAVRVRKSQKNDLPRRDETANSATPRLRDDWGESREMKVKKPTLAEMWKIADPLLARIENSDQLLSLVANWKERAQLYKLFPQWEADANRMGFQFTGNLWAVMCQRATYRPKAFPKFLAAVRARKDQQENLRYDQMANRPTFSDALDARKSDNIHSLSQTENSVSPRLPEDWGEPLANPETEDAEEKPEEMQDKMWTKAKEDNEAELWNNVDSLLARIEDSEVLLSLVANWEARRRLDELVQRWETEAKLPDLFAGNLWAVMTQRVVIHHKKAFPKFFKALMARGEQEAEIWSCYNTANSDSSGLNEDRNEPPAALMLQNEEAEETPSISGAESGPLLNSSEPGTQGVAHQTPAPVTTPPNLAPESSEPPILSPESPELTEPRSVTSETAKPPTLSPASTQSASVPPKPTELFSLPLELFITRLEELDILHEHDIRGFGERLREAGVTPDLIPAMDNGELESLLGPGKLKTRLFLRRAVRWESYRISSGE